jgi:uncharacterized protein
MPTVEQARQWYPQNDPVHGFDHILRVLQVADILASSEGADREIVRAAALLHDAQGDLPRETDDQQRQHHHITSLDFAAQILQAEDWDEDKILAVQHCIRSHRFRDTSVQPQTIEAQVLFDADKLDAIGAVGVARAIAYAASHGQPFFSLPSEKFLTTGEREEGEPHTAYHEFCFKLSKLKRRLFTASARSIAEDRHLYMENYFKRLQEELSGKA